MSIYVAHWTNTPLDMIWRWRWGRLLQCYQRTQKMFEKSKGTRP
jgi:hypothetical protein